MITFLYGSEFIKDFKKLKKAYPSLGEYDSPEGDFSDLKKFLEQYPVGISNVDIERIDQLGSQISLPVYKIKKFACKTLQSSSKLRIIYVYDNQNNAVEFIEFIEFYAKADKENEDRERIKRLLSGKSSLETKE